MSNKNSIILLLIFVFLFAREGQGRIADSDISKIIGKMNAGGEYETNLKRIEELKKEDPKDLRIGVLEGIARYGLMDYSGAYASFESVLSYKNDSEEDYIKLSEYALRIITENKGVLFKITAAKKKLSAENITAGDAGKLNKIMTEEHIFILDKLLAEEQFYPSLVLAHILFLKEHNPGNAGLERLSGDVYYSAALYREASESYKKAFEKDPEDPELARVLADSFVAAGNLDEGGKYYEKAIMLLEKNSLDKKTEEEIKSITKIKNALPRRYEDISELIDKKLFRQAEKICRKRISLNPGDYTAITQLARICWETGRRWQANRLFKKVIRIAPDYPLVYLYFGRAYFLERKQEKALILFDKYKDKMNILPKMDDKTVNFYINGLEYISYVYTVMKDYMAAIVECEKIIKLDPGYQRGYFNLAVCYYHIHNRPKTHYYLKKAISIDPSSKISEKAKFFVDFLRRNPDSRVVSDFSFIYER